MIFRGPQALRDIYNDVGRVKTLVGKLRHSRPDLTAGTYIHGVPEENLKAQGQFMRAMRNGNHPSATGAASLMATRPATDLVQ